MTEPAAVDLRTTYLGLPLSSPIVASAGPLAQDVEGAKALADGGVGAIVLPSLFEEEIVAEEMGLSFALEAGSEHFAEALSYFPATPHFTTAADRYLDTDPTSQEGSRSTGHCQSERDVDRWLGPLRQTARRCRRRRSRTERLPGTY